MIEGLAGKADPPRPMDQTFSAVSQTPQEVTAPPSAEETQTEPMASEPSASLGVGSDRTADFNGMSMQQNVAGASQAGEGGPFGGGISSADARFLPFPDSHGNPIPANDTVPKVLAFPNSNGNPIPVTDSPAEFPFPSVH